MRQPSLSYFSRWTSERDFFGIETSEFTAVMIRPGTSKEEVDGVVARLREAGIM